MSIVSFKIFKIFTIFKAGGKNRVKTAPKMSWTGQISLKFDAFFWTTNGPGPRSLVLATVVVHLLRQPNATAMARTWIPNHCGYNRSFAPPQYFPSLPKQEKYHCFMLATLLHLPFACCIVWNRRTNKQKKWSDNGPSTSQDRTSEAAARPT